MELHTRTILPLLEVVKKSDHTGPASAGVLIRSDTNVLDCFSYMPGYDDTRVDWLARVSAHAYPDRTLIMSLEPSLTQMVGEDMEHPMLEAIKGYGQIYFVQSHPLFFRKGKSVGLARQFPYKLPGSIMRDFADFFWHKYQRGEWFSDRVGMEAAIAVAAESESKKYPHVGASLVDARGRVLATGTQRILETVKPSDAPAYTGYIHAERDTLNNARKLGLDTSKLGLCATYEPTAPYNAIRFRSSCEEIARAKVQRVVVGNQDANAKMGGRAIEYLRAHGIEAYVLKSPKGVDKNFNRELEGLRGKKPRKRYTVLGDEPTHRSRGSIRKRSP